MKNNRNFQIEKTGFNNRQRKQLDILAVVIDANNEVIDAICPGTGNHRTALDWAEWRSESIHNDYPATVRMEVYCGDAEIAVITFAETPSHTTKNETTIPQVLTTSNYWHTDHFTVVDKFPAGAIVWNIGRHNFPFPEFIPVAFPIGDYKIDRKRLMAVRCKDAETANAILKAAGRHTVDAKQFADLNA